MLTVHFHRFHFPEYLQFNNKDDEQLSTRGCGGQIRQARDHDGQLQPHAEGQSPDLKSVCLDMMLESDHFRSPYPMSFPSIVMMFIIIR